MRLNLLMPWAARHSSLRVLRRVLRNLMLRRGVRHHHVWLRGHGLVGRLGMLAVWRRCRLLGHGSILGLRRVVHRLLWHLLRSRLGIHASMLVVARGRRNRCGRVGLGSLVNGGVLSMHCRGHHVRRLYCGRVSACRAWGAVGARLVVGQTVLRRVLRGVPLVWLLIDWGRGMARSVS